MAQKQIQLSKSIDNQTCERLFGLIKKFQSVHLLVIGDFILDEFVWGRVERISPEAPVPVVNVERRSFMPGGALNVANNIRSLNGTVYPCGVIGRDLYGRMLVKRIRQNHIETGGVLSDKARLTSLKTRIIAHHQQVVRYDHEQLIDLTPAETKKILGFASRILNKIDAVIIGDYGKGVVTPKLLSGIVRLAKKKKIPILVDPKDKNFNHYKSITAVTPNKKEAYAAYEARNGEKPTLDQVGNRLIKKFKSEAVLITLGEEGMALFEKNGRTTKIPTTAREVFDVSGAGDTVISVFGLALAAGASLKDAALLSNLAAGVVVGKLGTATLSQQELKDAVSALCH